MSQPLVRRAVELSSGSIVDVVRRMPNALPQESGEVVEDDDAVTSTVEDTGNESEQGT